MIKLYLKILLCFILIFFQEFVHAQDDLLNKKITITLVDQPLDHFLQQLELLAGIHFSYSPDEIPLDTKVSIDADNEKAGDVLSRVFNDLGIDYMVVEQQVVLKKPKQKPQPAKPKKFTISGYIKEAATSEVLIGATVAVKEPVTGTISNPYGFYSLTLPKGSYVLTYSFIGYEPKQIPVELDKNKKISVLLKQSEAALEEVIVKASDKEETIAEKNQMSEINIRPKSVTNMPSFMGDADFIKSLQTIPGIKSFSDGSTSFFVRGGNRDQNLIIVDDAPIYNPSHFLGLYSTFVPATIKDISIYKGDLPARFGGRLSSVLDIRTKDGNMQEFKGSGEFGLITARLTLEGPFYKDTSSYLVSLRSSHVKTYFQNNETGLSDIGFYDLNIKLNFILDRNDRLYLSIYGGQDNYEQTPEAGGYGINWGNFAGTVRWNHIYNDNLFSNTTIYISNYEYNFTMSASNDRFWESAINNVTLSSDYTWYINPRNTMRFGLKLSSHEFNPGNLTGFELRNLDYFRVPIRKTRETALYLENEQDLGEKWSLRYGLRGTIWANEGPTTEYAYDGDYNLIDTTYHGEGIYNRYAGLAPRLSLKYNINTHNALKFSYTRTFQFIQLITNSVSPFTSMDIWLPSSPNIKPQKADLFVLGYAKTFAKSSVELGIEPFYKRMYNQIGYAAHPHMLLNPYIENQLRFGKAWSYGTELFMKKEKGKFKGWMGYTWSRSMRQIDGVNRGKTYPAFYDRPHDFSMYFSYKATDFWKFGLNWKYNTGSAYTTPSSFYYYNGYQVPIYTEKNNDRLPDYHRLDLSVTLNLNPRSQKSFKHSLNFTLFNLYGRKNPIAINYTKVQEGENMFFIPADYLQAPEIVPSELYLFGTVPSLTYFFEF